MNRYSKTKKKTTIKITKKVLVCLKFKIMLKKYHFKTIFRLLGESLLHTDKTILNTSFPQSQKVQATLYACFYALS